MDHKAYEVFKPYPLFSTVVTGESCLVGNRGLHMKVWRCTNTRRFPGAEHAEI